MSDSIEDTIEKVNRVKQKLIKYSEKNINNEKVLEYLGTLKILGVNAEIAKATEICQVLKVLKKKENPHFSHKAGEIIKEVTRDKSSNHELRNDSVLNNCVPKKERKPEKEQSNPSKNKTLLSSTSSTDKKSKNSESSKRLSEIESEQLRSNAEKRPKLSLQDYKKNYTIKDEFDMFDTKYSNNNEQFEQQSGYQSKSSKIKCEKESTENENEYVPYDPKAAVVNSQNMSRKYEGKSSNNFPAIQSLESKKSKQETNSNVSKYPNLNAKAEPYVPESISNKAKQSIVIPPVPSMSLEDLFGDSTSSKAEPYEPKIPMQPVTSLPRAATSIRPSSYIPSLKPVPAEKTDAEIDDALSVIMKQKQSKRMIYTGRKTTGNALPTVSKLYDLCSKTLIDSLDILPSKIATYNMTHDFAIAFELLKPVLEKANAKQLENIENYSPHLLCDTDYIWQKISEQEFKKIEPPDNDESWRELYFRKLDEREQQFQRARNLVSKMQKAKPVERVTQIATIKQKTKNFGPYLGPKSLNGHRPSGSLSSSTTSSSSKSSSGFTKSAPKVIVHATHKPAGTRIPPVMSQGMRATMKMLKVRKK